jgi:hypothetical protein
MQGLWQRGRVGVGGASEAMRYVGHMQTAEAVWYAWILEPHEGNRVVWSLTNRDHKPILSAIKTELKRLGIDRPEITAEWPDAPRPPGVD